MIVEPRLIELRTDVRPVVVRELEVVDVDKQKKAIRRHKLFQAALKGDLELDGK